MKLIIRLLQALIIFATASLLLGYASAQASLSIWTLIFILLGALWCYETTQQRPWSAHLFLVGFLGAAVAGTFIEVNAFWSLLCVIASLAAWDLTHFQSRLQFVFDADTEKALVRAHLQRLVFSSSLGCLLAAIPLTISLKLSFGKILFLTVFAVVGLCQFITDFRCQSN